MKRFLIAGALVVSTLAGIGHAEGAKRLVTILTEENPQTQLMAMVLTMQAAKQGAQTHMMLCGPAADIALKNAPVGATTGQPPKNMSPQGLMQMIMALPDAKVDVCAIYLPGKGAGQDVLLEGVGVAKPGAMAGAILASDKTISF